MQDGQGFRKSVECEKNKKDVRKMIEVAAAILHDRHGRILICQRESGDRCAGLWEFPGGKREVGESWEDCASRELREELGLEVVVRGLYKDFIYSYPDRTIHFQFYNAKILNDTEGKNFQVGIKWVFPRKLSDYEFCPADSEVVKELAQE